MKKIICFFFKHDRVYHLCAGFGKTPDDYCARCGKTFPEED